MRAASEVSDPDRAADILIRAERNANNALSILKKEFKVTKPRGIGLNKQMTRDWEAYILEYDRLAKEVFEPAEKKISEIVGASAEQAKAYLWQRKRFEALLKETGETSVKLIKAEAGETRKSLDQTHSKVSGLLRKTLVEITDLINDTQAEIQRTHIDEIGPDAAEEVREKIEKRINEAVETHKEILESVRAQLEDINLDKDDNGHLITQSDMLAAQEDELLAMKEQADTDLELVQLGMAVDIINHEFTGNIKSIRSSLRVLGEWASRNDKLNDLYSNIKNSFDHLDGYLKLFTPLQRRLYRTETDISGSSIANFIEDLFREKFLRHNVNLRVTEKFRQKVITGYPSTFLPVFVNLADNAVFWLEREKDFREICFDADDESLLVKDNGPGVPIRDRKAIFEKGFTRKPGGRGLGLFISRDVLRKVKYDLVLDDSEKGKGATFIIRPMP